MFSNPSGKVSKLSAMQAIRIVRLYVVTASSLYHLHRGRDDQKDSGKYSATTIYFLENIPL
jgi:hypothetical protein